MKTLILLCAAIILGSFAVFSSTEARARGKTETKIVSSTLADSPLLGAWDVTISAPGQDLPGTLKISKAGENFAGSLTTDLGEAPLKNIKIKDDSFNADITADVQGQSMEGTMTGKLANEKLSGEITLSGLGAIPYTGKKPQKQ